MKNYKLLNNLIGWVIFLVASTVYIMTSEPTASFWDCGEYIATAYKLQVGHPPGAPMFQLMGRFFSLFAPDVSYVAYMVNIMSALASGFTILFLFWSITLLGKKIALKSGEMTVEKMIAVFGSGIVGALAYTFSDSFWFSAVEGEVYATSSFFTAIVFWAILKWEENAEQVGSIRWVILIAYLMGLSIGVHLLNLLAIPAIVFVFYFRKRDLTWKGFFVALGIGLALLVLVMYIIIPQTVSLFAKAELMFVNGMGLPFNSGSFFFAILIVALLALGLMYTRRQTKNLKITLLIVAALFEIIILAASSSFVNFFGRLIVTGGIAVFFYMMRNRLQIINTAILCVTFLLIGYSTFLILVIRSNTKTPINENAPKNAIALLSYLNREQYGDWPLFYGQYYSAPLNPGNEWDDGTPLYARDPANDSLNKYILISDRKNSVATYDSKFCTIFPRMWSSDESLDHPNAYKNWSEVGWSSLKGGMKKHIDPQTQKAEQIYKPSFFENIAFFLKYQIGHMYLRYFMWNFVGRQNDIQNTDGNALEGNFYSGIPFVDNRLGPQDNIPANLDNNKGTNKLYFLPLILGLVGFIYHLNRHTKDSFIVMLLFFMTGLAIVLYLNQYPNQPRERDYAYAASFYAYAIWIGLGVYALFDWFKKYMNPKVVAAVATVICFFAVPYIMAKEEWDDHDRSGRRTCVDFATCYLESCAPNAILFTNGDNDTFPLWYAQEVEGIRTDVRVCNLSLLNTDWYIDQMKRKAYDSDAVPFGLTWKNYHEGSLDYVYLLSDSTVCDQSKFYNLKRLMDFVADTSNRFDYGGEKYEYIPTKKFRIPVDKSTVIANGTVPAAKADSVVQAIEWTLNRNGIQKNSLMILDLLANNNWKRPVYFAATSGTSTYLGLNDYLQLEGLAYRLVPVKTKSAQGDVGTVNTDVMYNNMMNKFKFGNINDTSLYIDETVIGLALSLRSSFTKLANALSAEGKKDSAIAVLDRCQELFPERNVPYNYYEYLVGEAYYKAGAVDKANAIMSHMTKNYSENLDYYFSFPASKATSVDYSKQQAIGILEKIALTASEYNQDDISNNVIIALQPYKSEDESISEFLNYLIQKDMMNKLDTVPIKKDTTSIKKDTTK